MKNLIKFGLGGIPGTGLNYIILYFSSIIWKKERKEIIIVSIVAFVFKEIVSFTIHKWWTFKAKGVNKLKAEIISYIGIVILITIVNTILFYMFVKIYNFNPVISQLIINLLFFIVNFPAMKKVFKKNPNI